MADITLSIELDNLGNDELDSLPGKFENFLCQELPRRNLGNLIGVQETDREEDYEEIEP